MIIIPAVDIKNGKCVRLLQGRMDQETVFADDPSEMALRWASEGAQMLHVVDLDGALAKRPQNLPAIGKIVDRISIPVQAGGGIRDLETIQMLIDAGVDRVVIGTEAIRNPELVNSACRRFPGRIVVGIDALNGLVAIEGWTQTTKVQAVDLARRFENAGVAAINFTDIHRDGMQSGPNIEATRDLAASVTIPVVASGGVSTLGDIIELKAVSHYGIVGVIVGRALYSGRLDLRQAIAEAGRAEGHTAV